MTFWGNSPLTGGGAVDAGFTVFLSEALRFISVPRPTYSLYYLAVILSKNGCQLLLPSSEFQRRIWTLFRKVIHDLN